MTKKLNRAPMELDLDSFLQSQTSSDEDDDLHRLLHHRTIDEILNDSDSSSSSSSSPPKNDDFFLQDDSFTSQTSSIHQNQTIQQNPTSIETAKLVTKSRKVDEFTRNRFSLGRTTSTTATTTSRPLPQLFGAVRVNPKPGAALAAAVAASRSITTPHAAAIKFRRQRIEELVDSEIDTVASSGDVSTTDSFDSGNIKLDSKDANGDEVGEVLDESNEVSYVNEVVEEQVEDTKVDEVELGGEEDSIFANSLVSNEVVEQQTTLSQLTNDLLVSNKCIEQQTTLSQMGNDDTNVDENSKVIMSEDVAHEKSHVIDASENAEEFNRNMQEEAVKDKIEEDSVLLGSEMPDMEKSEGGDVKDGEVKLETDDTSSKSEIMEVVEDKVGQLDSKKGGKKSGKKLRPSMKPIELAEELEKRHAYSGLHWEEGAAAQPMRLEGIRRGPPAVGYLDIDANNAITQTISSQPFRRDHGSPQALSVHANFIAVGMSKGLILVVPSKYSAQYADKMDAKMLLLAPQGEKSHSPVTSMCFNQQGDFLLAGYGNGHLIIWDVQRAVKAKVVTGEHTAPVVHTLFLGHDSQLTRQFKVVTGDCKGLVLLHTCSVVPLINHINIKTQRLLEGQKNGIVLSASALLADDSGTSTAAPGNVSASSSSIGSMMGGVVGSSLFSEGSSLAEEGVVIFVTHQNALVVRFSPNLEVYAQLSKPDGVRDGSMPHTAWKCASVSQGPSSETSDKASLLAIAWDRKVQVAKLLKSELKVYREWALDSAAIGVAWLDDQMLAILTSRRQFCLFSKDGNELHRTSFPVDISGADDFIVYHTHFSNVFGNPEKAYHNCLAVRGATIYVIGPMHLVVSRLLPWKERIQVLRNAGDWMGALDMSMRLYDGHAHGVVDLPRTLDAIREAVMSYLVELILAYVDEVFSYISVAFCNQTERQEQEQKTESKKSSVQSEMEDQFARVGGVAVEFCIHIKRIDILFDDIFSKFVAVQHGGTFLELLEPYILKDMLGCLPPEIMQALVEHYNSKGWLQRVEQCVLHMDISSVDFNQVVRLCREHGLYGALIYLFNKGLDDFKAPLEELLLVLQNSTRENAAAIGYRMLVYLKYCFSGLAFPPGHGILPATRLPSLRQELLQFLLEDSNEKNSEAAASFKLRAGVSPNLFHLLWLDTEATLEVLRFAFSEDSNSDDGLIVASLEDDRENGKSTEDPNMMIQNTVNTLVPILDTGISHEDDTVGASKEFWPSKKDMCHLLEFIAYFVANKRATVTKTILNSILEFLTSENTSSLSSPKIETSKRREKQMLTLLRVLPETDWDPSYMLHLCEKAQYYQVCGYIHTKGRQYVAALDSYLKDLDEPIHAFSFINSMLLQLRDAESVTFRSAVLSRIPELINLSREGTFLLIFDHYNKEREDILSDLRSNPKSLFLYLKATIEVHLSGTLNFSSLGKGYVMDLQNGSRLKDRSHEIELYLDRISDFPKLVRNNQVHITDEVIELYLELLCQYERNSVLNFLQTFENYRLERCLRLCQEYRVIDATAFLLERVGDVGSALLLTLSDLSEKFHMLDSAVENIVSDISSGSLSELQLFNKILRIEEVNAVSDILHSSIGICQRNSKRLDPEESEFLWFHLLDSFCEPLRDPYDDKYVSREDISGTLAATFDLKEIKEASTDNWRIPKSHRGAHILRKLFAQFIKEIVEGMIGGYVHLPAIMSKLLSDNGSQVFGDFKLIILGMLGTYGFEKRILDTAKSLIEDDSFYTMSLLKKGASHGYAPRNLLCNICSCPLSMESSMSGIRVFNCGHTTHVHCEVQENGSSNGHAGGCPVCVPKKKTSETRNKSVFTENKLVKNSGSRPQQTQGTQHSHESDLVEKPYGNHQISRFEILSNLKKSQRSFQVESLPQLRLAPPAVYHEKIQKGANVLTGESSSANLKGEKSSRQSRELKMKSSLRFPLKSSIFGSEMKIKR